MPNESPEISILDELRRGGFEFSFATTYNAYLPFYEDVVWRHLTIAGCRANVLLMDGRQCAASLSDEGSRPRLAGREYTLIPARSRGAFHPKLLMLVGRSRGLLFVGSHNLTVAGFGRNRELTSRVEAPSDDEAALASLGEAWRFMRAWVADQPPALLAAFDAAESYAGWLRDALSAVAPDDAETRFFGSMPEGENLWQRVKRLVPEGVRRVTVVSPFFDGRLRFLKRLAADLSPGEFIVGVEPGAVVIDHDAGNALPNVRFVDSKGLREGKGYLHAKAVLVEAVDGSELLVTGSANASWQAWLANSDERNAEAVIVTAGTKRQSAARALGLKELARRSALSSDDWEKIRRTAAIRQKRADENQPPPLIAVETEQGFDVEDPMAVGRAPSDAALLSANDEVISSPPVALEGDRLYRVDIPELGLRQRTSAVMLRFAEGVSRLALAHHTFEVAASAQTERQRDWHRAFNSLETDTPLLEDMLRIVERVIFDDFEAHHPRPHSPSTKTPAGERDADIPEAPQETFSVSLNDVAAILPHARHKQLDDLGVILNALNRRLAEGLEVSVSLAPGIARSEEELIGAEAEDEDEWREIDSVTLAAACRRRVSTLMRRMIAQLELAAQTPTRSAGAVRQLAAVLGILHRVRELELTAEWLPYDETLIRDRDEWKFFLDAARLLFRRSAPVMQRAAETYTAAGARAAVLAEPSIAAGLLLWLAWDSGLDVRSATDSDEQTEVRENLRGVARLVAMAQVVGHDKRAREKALEAISRHCAFYAGDGLTETWCNEHLNWLEKVADVAYSLRAAGTLTRPADAGDLVYPTLKAEPSLHVVLQSKGSSVKVVDLDKEDEQNTYGIKYVTVIKS